MILDNQLLFSDAQAITASAASTNQIDTGPYFTGNTGRAFGVGKQAYILVTVDVAFTDSGSDSTIAVSLRTDGDSAMGSPTTLATLGTLAALTPAGTKVFYPMPIATYERYIDLYYTAVNGNLTTGTISAAIVLDIDQFAAFAPGYTTGVE